MPDYTWSHETKIGNASVRNAETWLRATWEDGPKVLSSLLPIAWRYGLGLRLGPKTTKSQILGWHVAEVSPERVLVTAESWLLTGANSITIGHDVLRWQTDVVYRNLVGRLLWIPARIIHQLIVPWSVRRAVRRHRPG